MPPPSTGYGQHGDYVFGWKGDALQIALDGACFGDQCDGVDSQPFSKANLCSVPKRAVEDTDGCKFLVSLVSRWKGNAS